MKNTVKSACSIVLVVIMILSVMTGLPVHGAEEGLDLSGMQIVLPASPTAVERTAAEELQNYLYKITGVDLSIAAEGEHGGNCIYIGATNAAAGVTYPTEGDKKGEAWAIKAVGDDLFLVGAPTRGPLYAVYHLLEDVLGVRWWNLWEEDVPQGKAVVPENYESSGVPVMEYREIFVGQETANDYMFYARNRLNGTHHNIPQRFGGEESYGLPAHVHTFGRYFPAEFDKNNTWLTYISQGGDFTTNPEWYSMGEDGKRNTNQLCLTNPGLRKEFANRLVKTIEYQNKQSDRLGIARPICFAIVPDDNDKLCLCADCQQIITTCGESDYVLGFVNEMAAAVKKAGFTDVMLEMLVYWNYVKPPVKEKPADNVQIRFADNFTDLLHGLDHPNNADSMKWLEQWLSLCENDFYYWQYVVNYNSNGIFPSMFYYGDDMTMLYEMGVDGWFAEQEQNINVDFWDMKLWLLMKLMEKPVSGEEYTALMDEFLYGYYGEEAGKYVKDYLYYMHERAEATDIKQTFGSVIIGAEWLSVQDILAGNEYFEKAFAAAGENGTLLRRLRAARCGLDRVLFENFGSWKNRAEEEGLTLPFTKRELGERIYLSMSERIAVRGAYDPDYPRFFNSYKRRYGSQQMQLPAEFDGMAQDHMLDYIAEDFRLAYDYKVVADDQSMTGQAICCDAKTRMAAGSGALIMGPDGRIPVAAYDPTGLGGSLDYAIGEIPANIIKANDGYHIYSLSWTVPAMGNDAYIYMLGDWGVQNPFMAAELQDMVGQRVKICISMKVEGVIDGSDPENLPVYYIDRILIVPSEENQDHRYAAYPGGGCKAVCTICGDVLDNVHSWDSGVITKKPTASEKGEKLLTCTGCGITKTVSTDEHAEQPRTNNWEMVFLLVSTTVLLAAAACLLLVAAKKPSKS